MRYTVRTQVSQCKIIFAVHLLHVAKLKYAFLYLEGIIVDEIVASVLQEKHTNPFDGCTYFPLHAREKTYKIEAYSLNPIVRVKGRIPQCSSTNVKKKSRHV